MLEEIALLQNNLESLRQIEVKEGRDFWVKYMIISEHLMTIRDVDTMREIAALLPEDASVLEDEKAVSEFLIFIRLIAQRAINIEIMRLAREVFRQSIALRLLNPSEKVQKQPR